MIAHPSTSHDLPNFGCEIRATKMLELVSLRNFGLHRAFKIGPIGAPIGQPLGSHQILFSPIPTFVNKVSIGEFPSNDFNDLCGSNLCSYSGGQVA